ncbi:MAG TPA: beta-propeller fold lactonase family protein [Bryobacteraceae bacterium]|nr:beta-propeller fold lactonase family protein [Bryobacteraceae bacterium]
MSPTAFRPLAVSLILSIILALAGCGSSGSKVCSAASCCGPGNSLCPAPQFLYAAGVDGQVSIYPVNTGDGSLGTPSSVAGPKLSLGMATLNNQFLYVSDPMIQQLTSSIDAWSINSGTGALTPVQGSPFPLGQFTIAAGMATNSAAQVIYVADAGRIDALKADAMGALTPLPNSPFLSGTNLFLTVDPGSRFLFASDDTPPGGVLAFTIDSSGALTAVPNSPFPVIPNSSTNAMPFGITFDSTGTFVYTVLQATGQVAGFSVVTPSGALNPIPGSPFATGSGPVTLTSARNFLYVSNATDRTISGYSISAGSGMLTPLANSPFPIAAAALTTDPSGRFLYAASPTGLLAFAIDGTTGNLTPAGTPIAGVRASALAYVP